MLPYLLLGWLLLLLPTGVLIGKGIHRGTSVVAEAPVARQARGTAPAEADLLSA